MIGRPAGPAVSCSSRGGLSQPIRSPKFPVRFTLDHQTEFFCFYRTLTFYHALALLRQHIVASLNRLFARQLALNARIVLTGFRQPADILDIRGRMERGEISFGEAVDQVKF